MEPANNRSAISYDSEAMNLEGIVRFALCIKQKLPNEKILFVKDIDSRTGRERETVGYPRAKVYSIIDELALDSRKAREVKNYLGRTYSAKTFGNVVPIEGIINAIINRYSGHFVLMEAI